MVKTSFQNINNRPKTDQEVLIKQIFVDKTGLEFFGFCIKGGTKKPFGIYVTQVEPDSLAESAGLLEEDEILYVNNKDFTKLNIAEAIKFLSTTVTALITIKRNLKLHKEIILIKRPNQNSPFGFKIKKSIELNQNENIYVSAIAPNLPASQTRLSLGDQIIQANDKVLNTLRDFYDVLESSKDELELRLLVLKRAKVVQFNPVYATDSLKKDKNRSSSTGRIERMIRELTGSTESASDDLDLCKKSVTKVPGIYEKIKIIKSSDVLASRPPNENSNRISFNKFIKNNKLFGGAAEKTSKKLNFFSREPKLHRLDYILKALDEFDNQKVSTPSSSWDKDVEGLKEKIDFIAHGHEKELKPEDCFEIKIQKQKTTPTIPGNDLINKALRMKFEQAPIKPKILNTKVEEPVLNISTQSVIAQEPPILKTIDEYEYITEDNANASKDSEANSNYIVLKIIKQNEWPSLFGLKLGKKRRNFVLQGFHKGGIAEELNLFETGMIIKKVNKNDLSRIKNEENAENLIEKLYKKTKKLEFLIKLDDEKH